MVTCKFWTTLFLGLICLSTEAQIVYSYNAKCCIELPDKLELQDSELNTVLAFDCSGEKDQAWLNKQEKIQKDGE